MLAKLPKILSFDQLNAHSDLWTSNCVVSATFLIQLTNLRELLCQIDNTILAHITNTKSLRYWYILRYVSNTCCMSCCIISELRPVFASVQLVIARGNTPERIERDAICVALNVLFMMSVISPIWSGKDTYLPQSIKTVVQMRPRAVRIGISLDCFPEGVSNNTLYSVKLPQSTPTSQMPYQAM